MELYGLKDKDGKEYKLITPFNTLLEDYDTYKIAVVTPKLNLKVGDWVVGRESIWSGPHRITDDFDLLGYTDPYDNRHATKDEIKSHLRKIAEEKYPIGTKYFSVPDSYREQVKGTFKYYIDEDNLTDGYGGSVYCQGKWAEIIPSKKKLPKTKEDIAMLLMEFSFPASLIAKLLEEYED